MKTEIQAQPSESFIVAALLTISGGFLDAYTFSRRDGVFANAQTGNFARIGISVANGNFLAALRYLVPIFAFVAGAYLALYIRQHFAQGALHWQQVSLLLEIVLLLAVGFIPSQMGLNVLANIAVSFVCAVQVESFRKFEGSIFASTMCTGNLRSATENLSQYLGYGNQQARKKCLRYFQSTSSLCSER